MSAKTPVKNLAPRSRWLRRAAVAGGLALLAAATPALAQEAEASGLTRAVSEIGGNGRPLSLSLQVLIIMGLLTVLPGILLMMTSFTRIIIVLAILRQALGLQQTPPNQVLVGLSLFLSFFIMAPTIEEDEPHRDQPYAEGPYRRDADDRGSGQAAPRLHAQADAGEGHHHVRRASPRRARSPIRRIRPSRSCSPPFVTSELKTAFQIGFLIFLPFIVIDLIVATVLMSLGMMMMSPTIISMPFKLLLFVLVDGWALTMGSLASSFGT
jgi:flagellar biosynthetic protein FliP